MAWDLVIRGGTLIDPAQGPSVRRDVAFRGGRVAEVGERLADDAPEAMVGDGRRLTTLAAQSDLVRPTVRALERQRRRAWPGAPSPPSGLPRA